MEDSQLDAQTSPAHHNSFLPHQTAAADESQSQTTSGILKNEEHSDIENRSACVKLCDFITKAE